jgi:fatty-acyl-CoA synthase
MNMVIDARLKHNDITLNFLPLFASIPEQFFPYFYIGATNVILEEFNAEAVCEAIQTENITNFDAVPTICIALIEYSEIDKYDFSSLTSIMYGSAPMPIEIIKKFMKKFPHVSLLQAYGLTEAGPAVTFLQPEDHVRRIGSIGREIINVSVRIIDEKGNDLPNGEVGELICQSRAIMKGYYNLPEETAKALRNGWLYTGDLAKSDENGFFYIVGRIKDIIKSGGFGIAPAEIEEVLYKHPKVKEAAVIGVPHQKWGEAVHAFIVPKDGVSISEHEILEFCEDKVARFKKPKSVTISSELPKNAYGKIEKKILKDMY